MISTWQIELPQVFRQFDYDTISDVILHIHYTARKDGDLADKVNQELNDQINKLRQAAGQPEGLSRLFSLRHEFVSEWYAFSRDIVNQKATLNLDLAHTRFPFFCQGKKINIAQVDIILTKRSGGVIKAVNPDQLTDLAVELQHWNKGNISTIGTDSSFTTFTTTDPRLRQILPGNKVHLSINMKQSDIVIEDIILICHYTI